MKMKRFLSLLLAGTLALALTACGGSARLTGHFRQPHFR